MIWGRNEDGKMGRRGIGSKVHGGITMVQLLDAVG
jgi:hypothetical protein